MARRSDQAKNSQNKPEKKTLQSTQKGKVVVKGSKVTKKPIPSKIPVRKTAKEELEWSETAYERLYRKVVEKRNKPDNQQALDSDNMADSPSVLQLPSEEEIMNFSDDDEEMNMVTELPGEEMQMEVGRAGLHREFPMEEDEDVNNNAIIGN